VTYRKNRTGNKKLLALWAFLGCALLAAVLLAVLIAPRASKNPDGLEKVLKEKGVAAKAEQRAPVVDGGKTSAGVSSLVGVLITLAAAVAVGLIALGLNRLHKRKTPTEG
jgi:hypothetical protein